MNLSGKNINEKIISFFKGKEYKKYKKQKIRTSFYKSPKLSFKSVEDRYLKLDDIITRRVGNMAEITDNGEVGHIDLAPYPFDEEYKGTMHARYGYVINVRGGILFCKSIEECLTKYALEISSTSNPYKDPPFLLRASSKESGITTISNIEYPLVLELLQRESFPILIDGEVMSDNLVYYGYKRKRQHMLDSISLTFFDGIVPPQITYGSFYLNSDNLMMYAIAENLLEIEDIEIDIADVKKIDNSVVEVDGLTFYKSDIKHYRNFDQYLLETKSSKRDIKLDVLLK